MNYGDPRSLALSEETAVNREDVTAISKLLREHARKDLPEGVLEDRASARLREIMRPNGTRAEMWLRLPALKSFKRRMRSKRRVAAAGSICWKRSAAASAAAKEGSRKRNGSDGPAPATR